jgi:hypothetical protein
LRERGRAEAHGHETAKNLLVRGALIDAGAYLLDEVVAPSKVQHLTERGGSMQDLLDLRQQCRLTEDEPARRPFASRGDRANESFESPRP